MMLKEYVGTFNDPFAHKFGVMLGLFGQRTHAVEMQGMANTKSTDYFTRK
ncbi:hypothetical protein BS17DRAFT_693008 [Gyrodon lividus]|nr:hypothetical protein BS17DRAFT_693008 [Gyrodon lividus]